MRDTGGHDIRRVLSDHGIDAIEVTAVSGGDISRAYRVQVRDGRTLFGKSGDRAVLSAEKIGLDILARTPHGLVIPEPQVLLERSPDRGVLVLSWLEESRPDGRHWEQLGRGLADLHRCTAEKYGVCEDNFIGRLPQSNDSSDSWVDFFVERRLERQVRLARDPGRWDTAWDALYRSVKSRVATMIPDRPPASLVHGDLWSGNAMATTSGASIIDPAVYHGHREVDLAMTELFGGFSTRFYAAYNEAYPLEDGYEERRDLYNLYHVLNHLNHFGGGYARSVELTLRHYGG